MVVGELDRPSPSPGWAGGWRQSHLEGPCGLRGWSPPHPQSTSVVPTPHCISVSSVLKRVAFSEPTDRRFLKGPNYHVMHALPRQLVASPLQACHRVRRASLNAALHCPCSLARLSSLALCPVSPLCVVLHCCLSSLLMGMQLPCPASRHMLSTSSVSRGPGVLSEQWAVPRVRGRVLAHRSLAPVLPHQPLEQGWCHLGPGALRPLNAATSALGSQHTVRLASLLRVRPGGAAAQAVDWRLWHGRGMTGGLLPVDGPFLGAAGDLGSHEDAAYPRGGDLVPGLVHEAPPLSTSNGHLHQAVGVRSPSASDAGHEPDPRSADPESLLVCSSERAFGGERRRGLCGMQGRSQPLSRQPLRPGCAWAQ